MTLEIFRLVSNTGYACAMLVHIRADQILSQLSMTNFDLILSILSQDIEQKPNFDVIKGRKSVAILR